MFKMAGIENNKEKLRWSLIRSIMSWFITPWKWKSLSLVQLFATPWTIESRNSPGQSTGAGSCSLLQGSSQPRDQTQVSCIAGEFFTNCATREAQNKSESEVAQSCPTLCDPTDCSLPGSSVRGIFQAGVLEWVAISFSRGSSWPRDWTQVFHVAGRCFTFWAPGKPKATSKVYWHLNPQCFLCDLILDLGLYRCKS